MRKRETGRRACDGFKLGVLVHMSVGNRRSRGPEPKHQNRNTRTDTSEPKRGVVRFLVGEVGAVPTDSPLGSRPRFVPAGEASRGREREGPNGTSRTIERTESAEPAGCALGVCRIAHRAAAAQRTLPERRTEWMPEFETRASTPIGAERVGFEPTEAFTSHAFQACRFGRSRTPPGCEHNATGRSRRRCEVVVTRRSAAHERCR